MAQRRAAGASSPTPARPGPGPAGPAARRTGWGKVGRHPLGGGLAAPGEVPCQRALRHACPRHWRSSPRCSRPGLVLGGRCVRPFAWLGAPRAPGVSCPRRTACRGDVSGYASSGFSRTGAPADSWGTAPGGQRFASDDPVRDHKSPLAPWSPARRGGSPPKRPGPSKLLSGRCRVASRCYGSPAPRPRPGDGRGGQQRQAERPGDRRRRGWVVARLGSGRRRGTPGEADEACITVPIRQVARSPWRSSCLGSHPR